MRNLLLLVVCVAGLTLPTAAVATDIKDPGLITRVREIARTAPAGQTVSFADGLYDAADRDVYVDGNADAVWRLRGDKLVPAPTAAKPVSRADR